MYDLMKKQSQGKPSQQHIPSKLLNLLDEGMQRQEEYLRMIQELKKQKQEQAMAYVNKLQEVSKLLGQFKKGKQSQTEQKQFRSFEMKKQEEARKRPKRTFGKKQFTMSDASRFALEIQVKFLFFTPLLEDLLASYYPEKLQIKFEFVGEAFSSGRVGYGHTESEVKEMIEKGYPFVLESSSGTNQTCFDLSLQVKAGTSKSKLEQLVTFMKKGTLEVQVWDDKSKLLYGVCYLSLAQLLYYDKSEDYWVESIDIFSPLRNVVVGKLDVEFRNYKSPLVQNTITSTTDKLRVTSSSPLQPQLDYDIKSAQERQRRMMRRINHFKEDSIKLGKSVYMNFQFDYLQSEMNRRKLQHIIKHKEENKFSFSEQVFSRIQSEEQYFECNVGCPLIIPCQFTSNAMGLSTFEISIPETTKQVRAVSIVTSHEQFLFHKRQQKIQGHSTQIDPASLRFSLGSGETICILIKYLTLVMTPEKTVEIRIQNDMGEPVQTYTFRVKTVPQLVDHRFRLYQSLGATSQLNIPVSQSREQADLHLHSNCIDLTYSWNKDSFLIRVKVKADESILVFLYESKEMRKLLRCYLISVYSFNSCDFRNIDVGFEKTVQLQIPPSRQATDMRFFSSNPQILWPNSKSVSIKTDTIGFVTATGRTFSSVDQNVILTCNKTSGEVLYQWLFKFRANKPVFKRVINVVGSTKRKIQHDLQIQNTTKNNQVLGIVSSNLSYVQIIENKKVVNCHQRVTVPLVVLPHTQGNKQIIINVSNLGQSLNVNYLLEISFTDMLKQGDQKPEEIIYRRY